MKNFHLYAVFSLLVLPPLVLASPKVAKLGVIAPLTLGNADAGKDIVNTVNLFNKMTKKDGEAYFEMVIEDGQCGVGNSPVTAANKLINIDKVDFLITACSGTTLKAAPIAIRNQVPLIAVYSSHPDIGKLGPYVFRTFIDAEKGFDSLIRHMKKHGEKIGIISEENQFTDGHLKILQKNLRKEIVYSDTFQPENADFRTQLTLLKSHDLDLLYFNAASPKTLTPLVIQAKQLGISQPIYTNLYGGNKNFLEQAQSYSEGIYYFDMPSLTNKTAAFEKFYLKLETKPTYDFLVSAVYNAMMTYYDALQQVGTTSSDVVEFLKSYKGVGAIGPIEYDESGDIKNLRYVIRVITNGAPQEVSN